MYERTGTKPEVDQIMSSRVDMLIAIYDAAITSIGEVLHGLGTNRPGETALAKSQAIVLVGLIENGLDLTQGEIPNRIKELCQFVEQAILNGDSSEMVTAQQVLTNLRDGFIGIKEEASRLEAVGKIPQLSLAHSVDTVV